MGKQLLPVKNKFAVFIKIVWCRCVASAAVQPRRLGVHNTKSPAGTVQSAQWRELEVSSSRAPAEFPAVMPCPVGSRNFVPRPVAVEPPTGGKNMRTPRPHTPRQVRSSAPRQNKSAVFINHRQENQPSIISVPIPLFVKISSSRECGMRPSTM